MCGIAGLFFPTPQRPSYSLGQGLVSMLSAIRHRGPDSCGVAVYDQPASWVRLTLWLENPQIEIQIRHRLAAMGAQIISGSQQGGLACWRVSHPGGAQAVAHAMAQQAGILSVGDRLRILKDVGGIDDVGRRHGWERRQGSHGLGHVRLATESAIHPLAAHPFWATGFADIAVVHNGQITNDGTLRRRLQRAGHVLQTQNDSELVALFIAERMGLGQSLAESLAQAVDELDGSFSFLVSAAGQIGFARDRMGAKPLVICETPEWVALASEECALCALAPHDMPLTIQTPPPGASATWSLCPPTC